MINLDKKVEDLKNSVTVNNKKLVDTSKYGDPIIKSQISTLLRQNVYPKHVLEDKFNQIFLAQNFKQPIANIIQNITREFYIFLGWHNNTPLYPDFWKEFGSAPFVTDYSPDLKDAIKNGAKGMIEIFESQERFSTFSYSYQVPKLIDQLPEMIDKKLKELNKKVYHSDFKNMQDMEDNTLVKNISIEAEKFWMDETKDLNERIKVFNKYGNAENYIYEPTNHSLKKIFERNNEDDRGVERKCIDVIDWWIENLKESRCYVDYSENQFHPTTKKRTRNYKPSKAAIQRLRKRYIDILFFEGTSKYRIDW